MRGHANRNPQARDPAVRGGRLPASRRAAPVMPFAADARRPAPSPARFSLLVALGGFWRYTAPQERPFVCKRAALLGKTLVVNASMGLQGSGALIRMEDDGRTRVDFL